MKLKIGVVGASGRMGQELARALDRSDRFFPEVGIDTHADFEGFKRVCKFEDVDESFGLAGLIDFSTPEAIESSCQLAANLELPLVIGTTGLSEKKMQLMKELSESVPVFWSPNMSLGVALFIRALKGISPDASYDVHIEEIHHRHKKDQPSGTAKLIHSQLEAAWSRKISNPASIRGGGDFGTHTVRLMGPSETLSFTHQALSRAVFAEGAVSAMEWLIRQRPGFYGFDEYFASR